VAQGPPARKIAPVEKRKKLLLIVAAVVAAVLFVVALAWWDAVHPLRYLRGDRVIAGHAWTVASKGRVGRDLAAGEVNELCRLVAGARSVGPVDTPAAVRVELATMDYGAVQMEDLSGPGARVAMFAGTADEQRVTVRSAALGKHLARLAAGLAAKPPVER